jgi:multidrug resistance efflux pump
MNKIAAGRIAVGIVMIALTACNNTSGAQPAQPTANATQAAVKVSGRIVAEGRVVPVRNASLSFTVGGVVSDVLVAEGARVEANQVLVRLDARKQAAAVAQAQAALQRAQSRLAALKAGPRQQEVDTAQAALDAAQAQLAILQQGARPADVSAANANVAIAQAQLQQVKEGASQQQIDAAQADVANAQAALKQAQFAYDSAYKFNPAAIGASPAALQLEQATNNYNAAKARYDDLIKGATPSSFALAQARVQQAVAQLNAVKSTPRQADIDAVNAEIRRAQAQLDLIKAGVRTEDISAAQSDVDAAQAALDQAQAARNDTELRAPFAGVVAFVSARNGEQAVPSTPVIRIGDTSAWEVETTDLTELNIVNIKEGAKATLTVDALPGVEIPGKVARIRQFGENKQGDIVYTVVVKPDTQNDSLRWNMTASVALEP